MKITAEEIKSGLTQIQYNRLLNGLAGAIHTQRKFITIVSAECVNSVITRYVVKCKGSYYPYLIEKMFCRVGDIYLNLGLIV